MPIPLRHMLSASNDTLQWTRQGLGWEDICVKLRRKYRTQFDATDIRREVIPNTRGAERGLHQGAATGQVVDSYSAPVPSRSDGVR